jgi:hypothetical protein
MTDAPNGGLPPADRPLGEVVPSGGAHRSDQAGSQTGGTAGAAKEQASQVGQTAKESGQRVAGTAAEQGKNVLHESTNQVRRLTNQATQQAQEQTRAQKDKASTGLRSLSDELHGLAEGRGTQNSMLSDFAKQAADKAQDLAGWLENREPGELLDEVRQLARRKPGTFLVGSLAAGLVAGRLTRGAVDASRDTDENGAGSQQYRSGTRAGTSYGTTSPVGADTPIASGVAADTGTTVLPGETVSAGQRSGDYR